MMKPKTDHSYLCKKPTRIFKRSLELEKEATCINLKTYQVNQKKREDLLATHCKRLRRLATLKIAEASLHNYSENHHNLNAATISEDLLDECVHEVENNSFTEMRTSASKRDGKPSKSIAKPLIDHPCASREPFNIISSTDNTRLKTGNNLETREDVDEQINDRKDPDDFFYLHPFEIKLSSSNTLSTLSSITPLQNTFKDTTCHRDTATCDLTMGDIPMVIDILDSLSDADENSGISIREEFLQLSVMSYNVDCDCKSEDLDCDVWGLSARLDTIVEVDTNLTNDEDSEILSSDEVIELILSQPSTEDILGNDPSSEMISLPDHDVVSLVDTESCDRNSGEKRLGDSRAKKSGCTDDFKSIRHKIFQILDSCICNYPNSAEMSVGRRCTTSTSKVNSGAFL